MMDEGERRILVRTLRQMKEEIDLNYTILDLKIDYLKLKNNLK